VRARVSREGQLVDHAIRGLAGYTDGGSYAVRDTAAVITGKLGTGYWKRSLK
jgi:hypothetical protein